MNYLRGAKRALAVSLVGLLLVGVVSAGAFSVAIDAPSESEVGDTVSIDATVEAGDQLRGDEQNVSVDLLIDGDVVATENTTVERNNSSTVTFAHQFDEAGDRNVTVVAETSQGASSEVDADSTIISISDEHSEQTVAAGFNGGVSQYDQCMQEADESYFWPSEWYCEYKYTESSLLEALFS